MRTALIALMIFSVCSVESSSKDKVAKIPYQQMVSGMRDAFDCGVIVEKYLHGSLKGNDDQYHQLRQDHNCGYVESILNSAAPEQPQK